MRPALWAVAALGCAAVLMGGCGATASGAGAAVTGGDSTRGAAAISRYGCGSCHTIAGITAAHGLVGPPLSGLRNRMYVGGVLRNTPENLVRWIRDPKAVDDKTAMPRLNVSERDATDIAAYLYSIR